MTALRLGEVSLAAFPGEMFCAYGRRIRDEAPGSLVLTLELCHDDVGYVPTPEELWRGGYESWSSIFPADTGHRVVEAALAMLRGLHAS
ncbi:MAG: hypothetical protein HYU66_08350 [Armatimonadetes bacterium]|nr:hypothetical protein [Armatimonadota bacterium]